MLPQATKTNMLPQATNTNMLPQATNTNMLPQATKTNMLPQATNTNFDYFLTYTLNIISYLSLNCHRTHNSYYPSGGLSI